MIVKPIPTVNFSRCHPEKCDHGICAADDACPHNAFVQEQPYYFPMHDASMCVGCGLCVEACQFGAVKHGEKRTLQIRSVDVQNVKRLQSMNNMTVLENPQQIENVILARCKK